MRVFAHFKGLKRVVLFFNYFKNCKLMGLSIGCLRYYHHFLLDCLVFPAKLCGNIDEGVIK